ncbi:MAG: MraY family glycosyltransferase [Syntrophobacteraceae bacterium]
MRTVLVVLLVSLGLALLLTPVVAEVGRRFGLVDRPTGRKVHIRPIPRIGGVAIYLAFFGPFLGTLFCSSALLDKALSEQPILLISLGATLVFLVGLLDDIFHLHPFVKFGAQTAAALLAYWGGISFSQLQLPWTPLWDLGWTSLPLTVFWFLLVINAFNLIDGLDGLAAGVCLFASLILLILSIFAERFLVAAGLAALAGACLGFLRYNFNPASIFMGDSGSYFLGYMLASLSVLGSMKSQTTVAILIPIIALGLPLMDTILAPIRRFIVGKEMFRPDKSHIHHKLLAMGFSHRNAVLLLYGATIVLGLFALLLVNAQDQKVALVLLVLGISIAVGIKKLGYLEYLAVDKVIGYLQDVTDVMGLSKDRRTFLNCQVAINEAINIDQLWERVTDALELLKIDQADIKFDGICLGAGMNNYRNWCGREIINGVLGPCQENRLLSISLPLADDKKSYGNLHLEKDLMLDPISHYTLRRIEHLRRTVVRKLKVFEEEVKVVDHGPANSQEHRAAKG